MIHWFQWFVFAVFVALTAFVVLPPMAPPIVVCLSVFIDALLFGVAIQPTVRRWGDDE